MSRTSGITFGRKVDAAHQLVVRQRRRRCISGRSARCRAPARSRRSSGRRSRASRRRASRARPPARIRPAHRPPAALGADAVAHPLVVRARARPRLLIGVGDIARRMDADRLHRLAELRRGHGGRGRHRARTARVAADDREHQRQVVAGRADDRLRAAADADPGLQRAGLDRREYALVRSGGRVCPARSPAPASAAPRRDRASPRTASRTAQARSRTAGRTR